VDPGPPLRIHGYEAHADLARHLSAAEITLLAYTGELPDARALALFDLALALAAPAAITTAAGNAAVLARLLAAPDANVVAIAASLAAEHAEHVVRHHAPWLRWCERPTNDPPPGFTAAPDDRAWSHARAVLGARGLSLSTLDNSQPSADATLLALLHGSGVREPLHLAAVMVQAALPCLVAEAQRQTPRRLQHYPIAVPAFEYRDEPSDD